MPEARILVVEDDKNISRLLKSTLESVGFACVVNDTGEGVMEELAQEEIDLVVLDVQLPAANGFDLCRAIRQDSTHKHLPVMMLTSRTEEVDRVLGFELGVDDYVAKPFSARELVLRIKAILKRIQVLSAGGESLSSGPLKIDISGHKVTVHGQEVQLAPMEFRLLVTLMQRSGRVQSRDVLLADVWGMQESLLTRTVDTHIKRLREKLGEAGGMIETVTGFGYKFTPLA